MESSGGHEYGTEADDTRLRYHLTALYALRPIPDDLLQLVEQIDERLQWSGCADD
jgi:hypothetical protein